MEAGDKSHPYWMIAELSARMSQPASSKEVTPSSIWWKFAAYNFIHNRIRDADRGFFANLGTLLAAKARTQAKTEATLPEKIKQDPEDEGEYVEGLLESNGDETVDFNIEKFYTLLVCLSQRQIGSDNLNGCNQASVLNHLQRAFKVDNEAHRQALDLAQKMKAPKMQLNVEVIEAKELIAKDSNGQSDPFCILYLDSKPSRRYNTAVIPETLTPIWKEHFELPLDDPKNDVLRLEVWDFDAAETLPTQLSKVKNVKDVHGILKFAKELAFTTTKGNQHNEFIGRCQIALQDIPMTGHTMWFSLEQKKKSQHRGAVRLKLAFGAEQDDQVAFQEHRHLFRTLFLYEMETEKAEKYKWCERWSAPAETIILNHSTQRGLLARNVALAQWIEYIRVHREHYLSFTLLNNLTLELLRPMDDNLFSNDEIRLFWNGAKILLHSCLNTIRKIRTLAMEDRNKIIQLEATLGILSKLNSLKKPDDFDLFPANMYSWLPRPHRPRRDVMQVLEEAVIQGSEEWQDHVLKNNIREQNTDEDVLKYCTEVIQLLTADLQQATDLYDMVFIEQTRFPYARTLFVHYGKTIAGMCMIIVKDLCARLKTIGVQKCDEGSKGLVLGTTLFKLYLLIQSFAKCGPALCADGFEHLEIRSYHKWFQAGVEHWLDIVVFEASRGIEKALEIDNLQPVTSKAGFSSSAVDTLYILYGFKTFWTQLAWPDIEDSYVFMQKIIDDICRCSVEYADKMACKADKATQQTYDLDNSWCVYEMKFEVSNAWCFAINNIDHICTSISLLADALGISDIVESLAEIQTQQVTETCRLTLQSFIENTTDTLNNKIIELLGVVADKMIPAMNRYLFENAESIDTTSNSVNKFVQYLHANIRTLQNNLNKTNFETVFLMIGKDMLQTLYNLIINNLEMGRPPSFYANLHRTLHKLIDFFNFGANETSDIEILEKIEQLLKLHALETADLIHRYNQERLQEQRAMNESTHGQLTVKAHFVDNLLNIRIMNARNLRPMDSNGECDPYVKILLLPQEKFAKVKQHKTQIHNANRFPLFDESFPILLSPELRKTEDAMVLFEVKDKDILKMRFMAEGFLAFSEIPETGPDGNFDLLEQIHLKLSKPTRKDSDTVRALKLRKRDDRAAGFLRKLNVKLNTTYTEKENIVQKGRSIFYS